MCKKRKESPCTVSEVVQDKKIKFTISKFSQLKYKSENKEYMTESEFVGEVTSEVFTLLKFNVNHLNMIIKCMRAQ